jgi:hypothetical protein
MSKQMRATFLFLAGFLSAGPADRPAYYTTGENEAHFVNGNPRIGTGEIAVTGENFTCSAWSTENGPGQLATTFLVEEDPQAGDTANANVLDD